MKKTSVILSLLVVFLLSFVSTANAAEAVFAFEDSEYTVLTQKTVKPTPIAQNIEGQLTYEWTSSDETVATVKNGTVKGISGGTVTITCTATAKDGSEYTATCTVHVNIPITSITAEKSKVEVALAPIGVDLYYKWGQVPEGAPYMYKPVVTITPADATNQTLEWSSADPDIASLTEDGTIYGVRSGSTTITGKATDGSGAKVKISIKVPSCYVTDDDITITEPEGMKIGYVRGSSPTGFSTYNIITTGKVVTFETLDDANGMEWIRIIPKKAGEGTLSFTLNGSKMRTIKIKVKHSAVYDNVSYPAVKVSKLVASPESSIGTKTHVKCEIIKIVPSKTLGDRGGIIYGMVKENNERQYVIFEYEYAMLYEVGDTQTIYGTVSDFKEYVTETGLTYTCPYFENGHINR